MKLRVGRTLYSAIDAATVIVIRAPEGEVTVTCGGAEMLEAKPGAPSATADPGQLDGAQLGKRYADDELGLEVLCSKAGQGTLAVNGIPLPLKSAKPLPASD